MVAPGIGGPGDGRRDERARRGGREEDGEVEWTGVPLDRQGEEDDVTDTRAQRPAVSVVNTLNSPSHKEETATPDFVAEVRRGECGDETQDVG